MRVLALEASTEWLSLALGDGVRWLERAERAGTQASERGLPIAAALLAEAGWSLRDIDGIAFGSGPGSFTGVRIACGIAQGLALGSERPLLGIPSLLALAQGAWRAERASAVFACLDARMREVYVAAYRRDAHGWTTVREPAVCAPGAVACPPGDWHACGDGLAAHPALARLPFASVDVFRVPAARAVGELALPRFVAGEGLDAASAEPLYVRQRVALTSAERAAGVRL